MVCFVSHSHPDKMIREILSAQEAKKRRAANDSPFLLMMINQLILFHNSDAVHFIVECSIQHVDAARNCFIQ